MVQGTIGIRASVVVPRPGGLRTSSLSAQGLVAAGEASKSLTRLYGIHMHHGPDAAYLVSEDEARVARRASALTAASACHEWLTTPPPVPLCAISDVRQAARTTSVLMRSRSLL